MIYWLEKGVQSSLSVLLNGNDENMATLLRHPFFVAGSKATNVSVSAGASLPAEVKVDKNTLFPPIVDGAVEGFTYRQ